MPLESISDILMRAVATETSPLLPRISPDRNMVHVTKDFLQSSPNGVTSDDATDAVCGFLSLLISYAKAIDNPIAKGESAKELTSIMIRTDYTAIYSMVKTPIPAAHIYDILKVIACYKNKGDGVE